LASVWRPQFNPDEEAPFAVIRLIDTAGFNNPVMNHEVWINPRSMVVMVKPQIFTGK